MIRGRIQLVDLFCGAGGSSTGAIEALELLGHKYDLTAVNHWNRAKETMLLNHPEARVLCESVDSINPRELFGDDELDILIASPECTHFSVARGGRPVNEQSRATAMCVVRWAEALRPPVIMVENVREFRTWGPLIRKRIKGKLQWAPDPKRKGELYRAWLAMMEACGYQVSPEPLNCANYGDPTDRKRLFMMFIRRPRKICWPNPTHSEDATGQLFSQRPWLSTRDHVIDWNLEGRWLDEMPGKKRYGGLPLSPNTLRRINHGFLRHGVSPFIVPQPNERDARSVDRPLPTITTTSRGIRLLCPYLVKLRGTNKVGSALSKPLPAVTSSGRNLYLAEPFLVNNKGKSNGSSIRKPMPTQTSHARHLYLAEPFLVPSFGERKGQQPRTHSLKRPLPTVTAGGHIALVEAAILPQQSGGRLRSVREPLPTVSTKGAIALVEPYILGYYSNGGTQSASIKKPLPTVTSKHRFALVCPKVIIDGRHARVRYRYRMLQWHELALGQGFRPGYRFAGNTTEKIKMIGNAVPRKTMRALILAAWGQDPNVAKYFEDEEELVA